MMLCTPLVPNFNGVSIARKDVARSRLLWVLCLTIQVEGISEDNGLQKNEG